MLLWFFQSKCVKCILCCVSPLCLSTMLHPRWVTRLQQGNNQLRRKIQTASACETGLHGQHVTGLSFDRPLTAKHRLNLSRTTTGQCTFKMWATGQTSAWKGASNMLWRGQRDSGFKRAMLFRKQLFQTSMCCMWCLGNKECRIDETMRAKYGDF